MITPDQVEYEEREHAGAPFKSSRAVFQSLLLLIPAILSSTTGQLFLKMGMNQVKGFDFTHRRDSAVLPTLALSPFIWIGFIGFIGGTVFWLGVISRAPLSLAYPILALSYFVVVVEAWLFLGEQVTWQRLFGVAIIVVGVIVVGLSERQGASGKAYKELLADCAKFKAANILPLAYGDRDGYSTDNWVTYNYVSFMNKGDIAKVNDGSMKYTDPKLVKPLQDLVAFKKQGCVERRCVDAREQRREHLLHLRQGRDGADVPVRRRPVREGARQEPGPGTAADVREWAAQGPGGRQLLPQLGDPEERAQPTGAWDYIKLATDKTGGAALASIVGAPPTNIAAAKTIKDPYALFFVKLESKIGLPLLDSVVPVKVALLYYKQLQAAFAGKVTPQQAMQNVQNGLATLNP